MGVKLQAASGGSVELVPTNTASTYTLTVPAVTASVLTDSSGVLNIGSGQVYKDASGNVGIGTSSPATIVHVKASSPIYTQETTGNVVTGGVAYQQVKDSSGSAMFVQGFAGLNNCYQFGTTFGTGFMRFLTGSGVEAARIDSSGNLLVGTTSNPNTVLLRLNATNAVNSCRAIQTVADVTTSVNVVLFSNPNGNIGSIGVSGSATSFNTSSDYRLKKNVAPMTGALAKVAALKPVTYTWKTDGSEGEGFIAHELAEVCPHAVTGEKDAVETYVDEDGIEQTRPVYQGIDVSFLVGTLTAAIQEQQAQISSQAAVITTLTESFATLTARIEALEAK